MTIPSAPSETAPMIGRRPFSSHVVALCVGGVLAWGGGLSSVAIVHAAESSAAKPWDQLSKKERAKLKKKAKRYVKRAKKAYKKGKYDDALVAFELAYKAEPKPGYLFNMGRCYEKKGDLFKAMELTQRYVDESQVGDEREDAEDMVEILRGKLQKTAGEVSIVTTPPGATVLLSRDDQQITGNSPVNRWLPAGTWKLEVSLPDHEEHQGKVSVALGRRAEVSLKLKSTAEIEAEAKAAEAEAEAKAEKDSAAKEAEAASREETGSGAAPSWPVFSALTSGGVMVVGAGVFGFLAAGAKDDLESAKAGVTDFPTLQGLQDDYEGHTLAANVLLAGGVLALAAGGALWALSSNGDSASVTAGPGGVSIGGRF